MATKRVKPDWVQFKEYVEIRDSGVTNMYDIKYIEFISGTGLTQGMCLYIMDHFNELAEEYGVEV